MLRTELIPIKQPTATGRRIYRFSIKVDNLNSDYEHQLVFFESHFCEIKYGVPSGQGKSSPFAKKLQFWISGQIAWSIEATSEWNNFAFDINYDSKTVGLWWSRNSDSLSNVLPSRSSRTELSDFHVGILRLPLNGVQDQTKTSVTYSNIAILDKFESGSDVVVQTIKPTEKPLIPTNKPTEQVVTTLKPTSSPPSTKPPTSSPPSSPSLCLNKIWLKCGGLEWTGDTCCPEGTSCFSHNRFFSYCKPAVDPITSKPTVPIPTSALPSSKPPSSSGNICSNKAWSQCNGLGFSGEKCCSSGETCAYFNQHYSQCVPNSLVVRNPTAELNSSSSTNHVLIWGSTIFCAVLSVFSIYVAKKRSSVADASHRLEISIPMTQLKQPLAI
jgi:hypothetical protein